MPQMMPLNWLELYIYFSMMFIMMVIMNFYIFNYKPKMNKMLKNKKMMHWKW